VITVFGPRATLPRRRFGHRDQGDDDALHHRLGGRARLSSSNDKLTGVECVQRGRQNGSRESGG
jgi:hypothetical protein